MRALTIVAVAVTLTLGGASARAGAQPHLQVLFVGNSLTATNDLPGTVAAFARAIGSVRIDVGSYAPGGYALQDHWADGAARSMLEKGGWDVVVLQQGPSSLPESRADLIEWTTRWAVEARAHGARPALLTVWPERDRIGVFPAVVANHRAAARAAHAESFPAGAAWWDALRRRRATPLYGPDAFHPSRLGTYLTAAVVYSGLTRTVPAKLPRVVGALHVDARTATRLRAAVARAHAAG